MRITHVIHTFPPFSRAGSENYLEALASVQSQDHEISIFHRVAQPERPEYEVTEGLHGQLAVVRINRIFSDFKGFKDTYECQPIAAAFGAYLDRFQPDVVHFHHVTCLSTTCVHEANARGIPVVFTLHDFWLLCPRGQWLRRDLSLCDSHTDADCVRCLAYQLPIEGGHERIHQLWERADGFRRFKLPDSLHRRLASLPFGREAAAVAEIKARNIHVLEMYTSVDRFIAPSRFLRDRYVDSGVDAEKVIVSDYGFDLSPWQDFHRAEEPSEKLRVAYLGTWIPSKGVHVLIEAFRDIDPSRADLDVHGYEVPFDGVDGYEEDLRHLAGDAPHIRFRDPYEPESVPRLLGEADVLVVPSIWYENSPLTIHEAFLAGIPVITSAHGGMQELVPDGICGLTFKPGSAADLRHVLTRLIEDRSLLPRLQEGIPDVKSIASNAAEIDTLYQGFAGSVGERWIEIEVKRP